LHDDQVHTHRQTLLPAPAKPHVSASSADVRRQNPLPQQKPRTSFSARDQWQAQVMKAMESTQQEDEVEALSVQPVLGGQLVQERHLRVLTARHRHAKAV
jgi:hypothetical protein